MAARGTGTPRRRRSALARLEAALNLVDHINPALAADQTVVAVTTAQRFQRVTDLHGTFLIFERPRSARSFGKPGTAGRTPKMAQWALSHRRLDRPGRAVSKPKPPQKSIQSAIFGPIPGFLLIPPPQSGGEGGRRGATVGWEACRVLIPPTLTLISIASSLPATRSRSWRRDKKTVPFKSVSPDDSEESLRPDRYMI
jgi:hypothetical protein